MSKILKRDEVLEVIYQLYYEIVLKEVVSVFQGLGYLIIDDFEILRKQLEYLLQQEQP